MSEVTYRIVEHDGGFAYKVGDVFSETFPSREEALQAAQAAAAEQQVPGSTEGIRYQDQAGGWHDETARAATGPAPRSWSSRAGTRATVLDQAASTGTAWRARGV